MPRMFRSPESSERGAVLVYVAICLLALIAFSAFVVDYGVMMASRGQAQTAADAGALSGAVSLAFNSSTDFPAAQVRAQALAQANTVWGQSPDVQLADVTFPPCPPGAPGPPDTCVRVDVFRNQRPGGSPLPVYFASLTGLVTNQGVQATATAQIVTGDTTDCLKPWAVVDRWAEFGEPWSVTSTYDRYSNGQGNNPPQENDVYTPPSDTSPGTGFRLPYDEGSRFAIKTGGGSGAGVGSGWFRSIDLPRADTTQMGGNTYQNNILTCNGLPSTFASPDTVCPVSIANNHEQRAYWAARGCYAVQAGVGSTANSIADLVARDPSASWSNGEIAGSSFDPPTRSPRVVPIGVMDVDWYLSNDPGGNHGVLRMVNIFGFFVEGMGSVHTTTGQISVPAVNGQGQTQAVVGRIMTIPSLSSSGTSNLTASASFLRTVILVR